MYSNAKTLSVFAVILGAANILASIVLGIVFLPAFKLGWTFEFAATIFLASSSFGTLLLTLSLRSALSDLSIAEEANASQIKVLKKRVEELENKVNHQ